MVRTLSLFPMVILLAFVVSGNGWAQTSTPRTVPAPPPSTSLQNTATPVASTPSIEQRTAVLEERLNTALAVKDERITDLKDRIDGVYKLAAFVATIATILLVLFSIRDVFSRVKEGQRQRGIDDIVKEMMRLQNSALTQQVRLWSHAG